jgi:hypothetical protein
LSFKFQIKNLNRGTDKGRELVQKSLDKFGMRDAIIIDKNGEIISGNHRKKAADKKGISKERIIKANSDEIIAIQYDDIDLSTKRGKELALALNQTAKINIDIDEIEAFEEIGEDVQEWGVELIDENGEEENEDSPTSYSENKYPLAIVLNTGQMIKWNELKEKINLIQDTNAFIKILNDYKIAEND